MNPKRCYECDFRRRYRDVQDKAAAAVDVCTYGWRLRRLADINKRPPDCPLPAKQPEDKP